MSLPYIRRHYGVPATRGADIEYTGGKEPKRGKIVGARGPHLRVRLDGCSYIASLHPTWNVRYLSKES